MTACHRGKPYHETHLTPRIHRYWKLSALTRHSGQTPEFYSHLVTEKSVTSPNDSPKVFIDQVLLQEKTTVNEQNLGVDSREPAEYAWPEL